MCLRKKQHRKATTKKDLKVIKRRGFDLKYQKNHTHLPFEVGLSSGDKKTKPKSTFKSGKYLIFNLCIPQNKLLTKTFPLHFSYLFKTERTCQTGCNWHSHQRWRYITDNIRDSPSNNSPNFKYSVRLYLSFVSMNTEQEPDISAALSNYVI